ncbi:MAG TPA: ethylbenzene dehydrogenase-related protein, partial [Candidatus Polarisedimenticolia bacterium]|nr:ethylbenzene dehydrogenase-related protein [Candidatus Polarisedimenticolia bacterium]
DAGNPVDLWFMDLAQGAPRQFTGKGSADVAPNDTGDVTAMAAYNEGEWTVTFKRPRTPSSPSITFNEATLVPVAFSVWDGHTRERGNRRALTVWYHLYLEPSVKTSPIGTMLKTAAGVLFVESLVIAWVRRRQSSTTT